jgi:hypothetical protein
LFDLLRSITPRTHDVGTTIAANIASSSAASFQNAGIGHSERRDVRAGGASVYVALTKPGRTIKND